MPDNTPETQPAVLDENVDQTPAQRLAALQAELQSDENQLSTLTKARDALKSDVDSLTKTVDEINKAKAAYEKTLTGLNDDKKKLQDYQAKLAPMLDGVLGQKKPLVDTEIKKVQDAIELKRTDVKNAGTNAVKAAKEALDAQTDLETRQEDYDGYKNLQKELGDKIQKMQSLKAIIDKFDDAKPASMYVYLRDLKTVLDKTDVPDQATFEKELNNRWKQLDAAKEIVREKKLAAEAAKGKWANEQTNLGALDKSRVDDLLKATDQFN